MSTIFKAGASAIFAFATAILFSSAPTMNKNMRRLYFALWGILMMLVLAIYNKYRKTQR